MRILAVRDDNMVVVNGLARRVTFSSLMPAGWRVVQWYGTHGELEAEGRNEALTTNTLATMLKSAWDNGMPMQDETPPPVTDVVAEARALLLDRMVKEEAERPDAPDVIRAAALALDGQRGETPRG